jgi:hypothetical protein
MIYGAARASKRLFLNCGALHRAGYDGLSPKRLRAMAINRADGSQLPNLGLSNEALGPKGRARF